MKGFYQRFKTPIWLIVSGLLTSLPLCMPEIGFLQWVSIVPMAAIFMRMVDDGTKLKSLYGKGVLFFSVYYSVTFHWFFYMYPLDFAGLSNLASIVVVIVACFGLGLFQALQSALILPLFGFISKSETVKKHRVLLPLLLASLWVVAEWWQTVGWWGVPWGRLPLGQIEATLLVRSASLFGSYFVTFIIVAVNFFLAIAINEKSLAKVGSIFALCLFCLNLALGFTVTLRYDRVEDTIKAAAIQGNIPSSEKWGSDGMEKAIKIYEELTEEAAEGGAKIVVWPETALPCVLFDSATITDRVSDLAYENDVTILISVFTVDGEGNKYNSIIEVRPDGSFGPTIYSKQRLVPFGEFVPMREFVTFIFPPLANIGMLEEDLTAGDDSYVIDSVHGQIGCGLCFDSIYETVITDSVRGGAEMIAISTNDSWFTDSAALDMHNSQSRLRAIENGRYVVRAANTGISSIIDPMGNVVKELDALERGYVISDVEIREQSTLYTVVGNLFVYVCVIFVVLVALISSVNKWNINFIKKN